MHEVVTKKQAARRAPPRRPMQAAESESGRRPTAHGTRVAAGAPMQIQFGLLVGFAAALVTARAAQPPGPAEIPFEFREGLIWVAARVPQSSGPLNFLLDSGAGVSVINLRTAERLHLSLGERVSVQGVGSTTEGHWPQRLRVTAGDVALPEKFLAVDLEQLSQACACHVDGLIGADFFGGRVVQIDFRARKIRLLSSGHGLESREALPLKLKHGAFTVPLEFNGGKPKWVRVDTGCAGALHWTTGEGRTVPGTPRTAVALTPVSVRVTQASVRLGASEFTAVPVELHEKQIFAGEVGLLGNGLLSRFPAVTIDARGGRLLLQQ